MIAAYTPAQAANLVIPATEELLRGWSGPVSGHTDGMLGLPRIIAIDLETTGTDPATARIVEIALVDPDGTRRVRRINPGIPIPPEATAVHGITDADVADCPTFPQIARSLFYVLEGVQLTGFNVRDYDIPLLAEEFARAGMDWEPTAPVLDAFQVFRHHEPRDLAAAVRFYLGADHAGAHGAEADAVAAASVLGAQLARYDISLEDVARITAGEQPRIDLAGKLVRRADGEAVYAFGKVKGKTVREDPGFGRRVGER